MTRYDDLDRAADLGLGADEPGIHRFTRSVERAELRALADHRSGRCANSEWSCSYCEQEEDAPGRDLGGSAEGDASNHHERD